LCSPDAGFAPILRQAAASSWPTRILVHYSIDLSRHGGHFVLTGIAARRTKVGRIKAADQATSSRIACDRKQNNDNKSGEKHV